MKSGVLSIGFDFSNGEDYSALSVIRSDGNKGECEVVNTFIGSEAELLYELLVRPYGSGPHNKKFLEELCWHSRMLNSDFVDSELVDEKTIPKIKFNDGLQRSLCKK